jgi:DNA polymerase-3 subunit alpha
MGVIQLSDPSGQFEAIIFAEGLQQFRDLLEPGSAVLLTLSAEAQGDDVRARIQSAEPLDPAAAKLQKGLRVFLKSEAPIESLARRLEGAAAQPSAQANGHGEVSVVLMIDQGTEVEVKLPGRFPVSPQIAGAIKAVPGVVAVEAL